MTVILRRCVLGTMTCLAFSAAAFFLQGGSARADPAVGTPQWLRQPDGTLFQARLWGDEFAHGWETLEGYSILRSEPSGHWVYAKRDPSGRLAATGLVVVRDSPLGVVPKRERPSQATVKEAITARAPGPGVQAGPPKSGTVNVPVLLIKFPDKANIKTNANIQSNLFGGGATGPGDLKDYYKEISYNGLTLSSGPGGIPNWVTANNNRSYYNTYDRVRGLVTEAIQKADAAGFNFAPYDNDSDGSVDAVVVVYAGCGPDVGALCTDLPPDAMWPHQWTLAAPVTVDGKQASVYTIQPELLWSTTIRTIGVFAHELGHTFGLPDLYDTVPGGTSSDAQGIGHWGLMGTGSWTSNTPGTENGESPAHMSAWEKWFMGWVSPILLQGSTNNSSIPQVETTSTVSQLLSNPNGGDWRFGSSGTGEYFLVENRQQTGFDQGLDGCGLLIWHVDESRPGDNTANGDETHKLVDLEEADGLNDLDNMTNRGDAGDPYRGSSNNTTFSDASTPSSNLYSGVASGASVSDISAGCTNPMTADLSAPSPRANGKIAFVSFRDDNYEIYVMTPNGGNPTNLTNNAAYDADPAWSPDGSKIAFFSTRDESHGEIYVMNADGNGTPTRLTTNAVDDFDPAWSPDGSKIAFHTNRDGNYEIYVMNADGSGTPTRLTTNAAADAFAGWSPDGSNIAFFSTRDQAQGEIYVMNADGSGTPTRLTTNAAQDIHPAWSPDGSKIAFHSDRDGNYEVYVMDANGGNQTNLTNHAGYIDISPDWQPAAFSSTTPTPAGTNVTVNLSSAVTVTFAGVTQAGQTTLITTTGGPPPPAGYRIAACPGGQFVYHDITTTASYNPPVEVCFTYDDTGLTPDDEARLRLERRVGDSWVDITASVDTANNRICGAGTSLSLFLMAAPAGPVGGLAELPELGGSSGPPYLAIASGLAAAALALTAGAWYARRRWLG